MGSLIKYASLSEEAAGAMRRSSRAELAGYVGEFFMEKKENCTYDAAEGRYYISSFFPSFPGPAWDRLLNGLHEIVSHEHRVPLQADIVVTGRCHCDCWHCFRANYGDEDLSLATITDSMLALRELGTASVGITGGEPMLRSDIADIIAAIPEEMEGVLYSTGFRIDEDFAASLRNTRLTRCVISLDHFEEEIACRLRRNANAYKDAVQAIRVLSDQGIYTAVTVCVTPELLKEGALEHYFRFVRELGAHEVRIVMPIPQGKLEGEPVGRFYGKAMGLVKQLRRQYASDESFPVMVNFCEFESSDYFGCGAGSNYVVVNNDGNVMPCVSVPAAFGNVNEESLESIYRSMGAVFKSSNCACFGISSSAVISRENIDNSMTPMPPEVSFEVAGKCQVSNERAALFRYLSSRLQAGGETGRELQAELPGTV